MLTTSSGAACRRYRATLSDNLCLEVLDKAKPVLGVENLVQVENALQHGMIMSAEELNLCAIYTTKCGQN